MPLDLARQATADAVLALEILYDAEIVAPAGVTIGCFASVIGVDRAYAARAVLELQKYVERAGDRLVLTEAGRAFAQRRAERMRAGARK